MKYSFITQHKNTYPISLQCQVLDVNRSNYYHHIKHGVQRSEDPEHQKMLSWVKRIAHDSDYTYGSRRMKKALNALSFPVSRSKQES